MDINRLRRLTEWWYLAFVIYREARSEALLTKIAVAHSVLNRVRNPKWWGTTVDQVVTKKWQYSSLTDPQDPQLARVWPLVSETAWLECATVAEDALDGTSANPLPGADSYHDTSIAPPKWTEKARFCGQLGKIRFYDTDFDYELEATHGAVEGP